MRSLHARPTYAAGESWRKWADPVLDPRLPVKPWWAYRAGMIGFGLIYAALGGLLAVVVR